MIKTHLRLPKQLFLQIFLAGESIPTGIAVKIASTYAMALGFESIIFCFQVCFKPLSHLGGGPQYCRFIIFNEVFEKSL